MAKRRPLSSRLTLGRERFNLPGVAMLGRYQYASSRLGLTPHRHRGAIEICFLERGEQSYRVGGLVYRLRGNDQFFTLPGEIHDTANLPEERGVLYWLILRLDPSRNFLGLAEAQAANLKDALRRMPARHFRAHPDCARVLAQLIAVARQGHRSPPASLHQIRLQALLLRYLSLTLEASYAGAQGSATPLMQRVLGYIERHLDEPVQVSRLAETAHLSESRFKARFKREIGVPPAEFWLRKKVEKAVQLLKKKRVTEVAFELGFSSSQYFATVLKRYTLNTPSFFQSKGALNSISKNGISASAKGDAAQAGGLPAK